MPAIRFDIGGIAITATLDDNATSRDFASLLSLTVTLEDYVAAEKVCDLPRRLSTEGAPAGAKAATGDVTCYAPWGNLAIFHADFGYANGLVKLGTLDTGMEILRRPGPHRTTISLIR